MDKAWVYPRFLRRLQAVLYDSILLAIIFLSILIIASNFGIVGRDAAILGGTIVLLWEPLWVSFTGGTVGHHFIGLRVVSAKTGKNINLFASFIRSFAKILLGQFSIIFVFITRYHQAIHDGMAGSVVILKHPENKAAYESITARQVELDGYTYPPVWLRIIMIVVYNIALIYLIGTLTGLLLPAECLIQRSCTMWQNLMLTIWQIVWMVGLVAVIVFCWKGRLLGCRRKLIKGE